MEKQLLEIKSNFNMELSNVNAPKDIEDIRVKYLGKKGELTNVLKGLGKASPEERPVIGQLANEVRAFIENEINEKKRSN